MAQHARAAAAVLALGAVANSAAHGYSGPQGGPLRVRVDDLWRLSWPNNGSDEGVAALRLGLGLADEMDLRPVNGSVRELEATLRDGPALVARELAERGMSIVSPLAGAAAWNADQAVVAVRVAVSEAETVPNDSQLCVSLHLFGAAAVWREVTRACKPWDDPGVTMAQLARPGRYRLKVSLESGAKAIRTAPTRALRLGLPDPFRVGARRVAARKQERRPEGNPGLFEDVFVLGSASRRESGWQRIAKLIRQPGRSALARAGLRLVEGVKADLARAARRGFLTRERAEQIASDTSPVEAVRLTPGAVGCAASHIALWERVAQTNRSALVLEDDVWLSPRFDANLRALRRALAAAAPDWDLLYLGSPPRSFSRACSLPTEQAPLRRFVACNYGTFAYVVSPRGARRLLDLPLLPLELQIDSYLELAVRSPRTALSAYLADPPLAYELKTLRPSTVQR